MTFYLMIFMVAMAFSGSTVIQSDRFTNPFVVVKGQHDRVL